MCFALAAALVVGAGVAFSARGAAARIGVVIDGDTVGLYGGDRVRLLQIDTPEVGTGECYSRAAQRALKALTPPGTLVRLDTDSRLDRVDRYGRLLRYIFRGSTNVNLELVRRGAAAPYFYDGDRGRYADALMTAAKAAKAARLGLWGACPRTVLDPYHQVETGSSGPSPPQPIRPVAGNCDPNYAGGCVPPYPPDLDCDDIRRLGIAPVRVIGSDPHGLDGDGDGWGCE